MLWIIIIFSVFYIGLFIAVTNTLISERDQAIKDKDNMYIRTLSAESQLEYLTGKEYVYNQPEWNKRGVKNEAR